MDADIVQLLHLHDHPLSAREVRQHLSHTHQPQKIKKGTINSLLYSLRKKGITQKHEVVGSPPKWSLVQRFHQEEKTVIPVLQDQAKEVRIHIDALTPLHLIPRIILELEKVGLSEVHVSLK